MIKLTEHEKKRILAGELASVDIRAEYFYEGDYTDWHFHSETHSDESYDEYIEWLIEDMKEKYDSLVLYSDGTLYGIEGGVAHDISYREFDEPSRFIELAEEYGRRGVDIPGQEGLIKIEKFTSADVNGNQENSTLVDEGCFCEGGFISSLTKEEETT